MDELRWGCFSTVGQFESRKSDQNVILQTERGGGTFGFVHERVKGEETARCGPAAPGHMNSTG